MASTNVDGTQVYWTTTLGTLDTLRNVLVPQIPNDVHNATLQNYADFPTAEKTNTFNIDATTQVFLDSIVGMNIFNFIHSY